MQGQQYFPLFLDSALCRDAVLLHAEVRDAIARDTEVRAAALRKLEKSIARLAPQMDASIMAEAKAYHALIEEQQSFYRDVAFKASKKYRDTAYSLEMANEEAAFDLVASQQAHEADKREWLQQKQRLEAQVAELEAACDAHETAADEMAVVVETLRREKAELEEAAWHHQEDTDALVERVLADNARLKAALAAATQQADEQAAALDQQRQITHDQRVKMHHTITALRCQVQRLKTANPAAEANVDVNANAARFEENQNANQRADPAQGDDQGAANGRPEANVGATRATQASEIRRLAIKQKIEDKKLAEDAARAKDVGSPKRPTAAAATRAAAPRAARAAALAHDLIL